MRPLVSIIVPVFNTPIVFVRESLASAVAQTSNSAAELIVFDDGSEPRYKIQLREVMTEFGSEIDLIFGETEENRGLCFARNDAVKMASGEYVLFLDSDDWIAPTIVEECRGLFDEDVALIYTNHVKVDTDGSRIIHERDKRVYQNLLKEFKNTLFDPLLHCTFIFHCQVVRRSLFLKVGGLRTDLGFGDEVDMHLRLSELSPRINFALVPSPLYYYRENPSSIVHDPIAYKKLISNIEGIIVETCQRRGFDISEAKRIGRALPTHAAHYALYDRSGRRVDAPYFDYDNGEIRADYISHLHGRPNDLKMRGSSAG